MISVHNVVLPHKPLSNVELLESAKTLRIPNFRRVFLRDTLPTSPPKKDECGILNLDGVGGGGTHWVAWFKNKKASVYFDSYDLHPPKELVSYLSRPIYYNSEQVQHGDQVFCGHLCLYVLKQLSNGRDLQQIINELY